MNSLAMILFEECIKKYFDIKKYIADTFFRINVFQIIFQFKFIAKDFIIVIHGQLFY